jgi:putative acetyltransferase
MALTFVVRPYCPGDAMAMSILFRQTVRTVNLGDYSRQQVEAWASGEDEVRAERWAPLFGGRTTFVAEAENGEVVGFADAEPDGHLDHLFVHHRHQRQGVATALHAAIELEPGAGA